MELTCEFIYLKLLQTTGTMYTCCITEASISAPGITINNFKGTHEAGKQNSSVEGFFAEELTIKYFPIGVNNYFRNLKHLGIDSCGLVSVTHKDLNGFEGLEFISFYNNHLTSLPSDLFVGFLKLKGIDFSSNKLEFISSKLLEPILQNKLEFVDFCNNTKIDAVYDKGDEDEMTLKQLMDMIDENCKKPGGGPGFDAEHFDERCVKSFVDMWKSKAYADFTIVTSDSKEIPVHKCVLGMQSKVFAAAFNTDMEENRSNRMVIDTFKPEAVEQFLEFFYTGRVPDDVHAMELFALDSMYDVPMLKSKCQEAVLRNLDEANAFEVFSLAHLRSAPDMKEKAFDMIKKSMPDKSLKDNLKNDPEKLKIVVEAARERVRKFQAVEDEFNEIKKTMEDDKM